MITVTHCTTCLRCSFVTMRFACIHIAHIFCNKFRCLFVYTRHRRSTVLNIFLFPLCFAGLFKFIVWESSNRQRNNWTAQGDLFHHQDQVAFFWSFLLENIGFTFGCRSSQRQRGGVQQTNSLFQPWTLPLMNFDFCPVTLGCWVVLFFFCHGGCQGSKEINGSKMDWVSFGV